MERNWMRFFRALIGRRSCPHTSANRLASLNTTDNQYQPGAGRRFSRHTAVNYNLDAPRRKLVCCCASHKIKAGQSRSVTAEKTGFLLNSRYLKMGFDFDPNNLDRGALPCRSWRVVRDAGNRIDFRGNRP